MATLNSLEQPKLALVENLCLVWIDPSANNDEQLIEQFYSLVDDLNLFQDISTGLKYLRMIYRERVLVIIAAPVQREAIDQIHAMPYVHAIYLVQDFTSQSLSSKSIWPRVKVIHGETKLVYPILAQAARLIREENVPISFLQRGELSTTADLDRLEPSFMYTNLLKKTLLDIEYDSTSRQRFIDHWRQSPVGIDAQLKIVDEFEREYAPDKAIQWYTRCSFIYENINTALRELDSDTIVTMAFLLHDLHQQLHKLQTAEVKKESASPSPIYRGQGLSMEDVEKLKKSRGGLMSFNSFLSTSEDREVSFTLADSASLRENMVGILFEMSISGKIETTPFADIRKLSCFPSEGETLFSMHAVFRIDEVQSLDHDGKLFEVKLTLTSDDDPDLRTLSDCIEQEWTCAKGWHRVADILVRLGRTKQVEDFYRNCLAKASQEDKWMYFSYGQIGRVKYEQGAYREAIEYYEKGLALAEAIFLPKDRRLDQLCNNIATVYSAMGEYSKAAVYLQKEISIVEETSPKSDASLGFYCCNLGAVFLQAGNHSEALAYLHKGLPLLENALVKNHPTLATAYLNMGTIYHRIGDYSKQLVYMQKAVSIFEKVLPVEHPTLASCYNNLGMSLNSLGEKTRAIVYLRKAISIFEKTLPANHPSLATIYSNTGTLCIEVKDYQTASTYISQAISIEESANPPNRYLLATYYNNMGILHDDNRQYLQALYFHNKVSAIAENIHPVNYHMLAASYNNIARAYHAMGRTAKGLPYRQGTLEISERFLSTNPHSLLLPNNNLSVAYNKVGNHRKALAYSKKVLSIVGTTSSANHPQLVLFYHSTGYSSMMTGEYSEALIYLQKALSIVESNLPIDQEKLANCCCRLAEWHSYMGEYRQALPLYQKSINAFLQCDSPNDQDVDKVFRRMKRAAELLSKTSG